MSITNGSEGSLGKEERPSLVMAVTRNRYRMPDKILDSVHSVSSVVDTSIHSCKPKMYNIIVVNLKKQITLVRNDPFIHVGYASKLIEKQQN